MTPPEPCKKPFSPCWCETRPNNPHCDVASVPIDSALFAIIATAGILMYLLKTKKLILWNLKERNQF